MPNILQPDNDRERRSADSQKERIANRIQVVKYASEIVEYVTSGYNFNTSSSKTADTPQGNSTHTKTEAHIQSPDVDTTQEAPITASNRFRYVAGLDSPESTNHTTEEPSPPTLADSISVDFARQNVQDSLEDKSTE